MIGQSRIAPTFVQAAPKPVDLWGTASAPFWRLVLRERASGSKCASGRLVLAALLADAGYAVSLVTIHSWSRAKQGDAYLWARGKLDGREDVPAPQFVRDAAARTK